MDVNRASVRTGGGFTIGAPGQACDGTKSPCIGHRSLYQRRLRFGRNWPALFGLVAASRIVEPVHPHVACPARSPRRSPRPRPSRDRLRALLACRCSPCLFGVGIYLGSGIAGHETRVARRGRDRDAETTALTTGSILFVPVSAIAAAIG